MTLKRLHDLLDDHFAVHEVEALIEFARVGYEDAIGEEMREGDDHLVYDFIRNFLWNCSEELEEFNEVVADIIGRRFTKEEFFRLLDDMDARWMDE